MVRTLRETTPRSSSRESAPVVLKSILETLNCIIKINVQSTFSHLRAMQQRVCNIYRGV